MNLMEQNLETLQLFYASLMADSVYHYNESGILSLVTEEKRRKQAITAAAQIKQLGIKKPEQLFSFFSNVFGCIKWEFEEKEKVSVATGKHCLLCNIARKIQTAQPCFVYCINPFREMLNAMEPSYKLSVNETLWSGERCLFKIYTSPEESL